MSRHVDLLSDPIGPAGHKPLSRTVADWLAQRIINGESAPGERLTEPRLAELAGVSRSPVREALRILQGEGLVEITPRHGARVTHVGVRDARELYACRLLLEPRCAYEAVEAITAAGVAELERIRAAMEASASDGPEFLRRNVAYFGSLARHCPNALLREFVELTWANAQRYWSVFARVEGYSAGSLATHVPLHEAVRAGDAAAARAADHAILERARNVLVSTLEQQ
jgi:GntR family transcriptional regulator, rspAB operon transcriptional repressor